MYEATKNAEAFACDANARTTGLLGKLCENLHFAVSVLLGAVLFAALFILKLPLRFDWPEFLVVYAGSAREAREASAQAS